MPVRCVKTQMNDMKKNFYKYTHWVKNNTSKQVATGKSKCKD